MKNVTWYNIKIQGGNPQQLKPITAHTHYNNKTCIKLLKSSIILNNPVTQYFREVQKQQ